MPLMSPPDPAADFWSAGSLPDVEQESFLAALEPAEQAALRERGTVRRFASGAALFHEQTVPSSVSILIDGRVKLTRVTADGRDVLLAIRGPGDVLGEQSAIEGEPRSATAVALEPVEALNVTAADFISFVSRTPSAATYMMRLLSSRLRDADDKRVGFAAQDTLGRVAARLVELGERYGAEHSDGDGDPRRPAHRPRDHAGGPRRVDRNVARGRQPRVADAAFAELGRDRAALDRDPRPRRAARPVGMRRLAGLTGLAGGRAVRRRSRRHDGHRQPQPARRRCPAGAGAQPDRFPGRQRGHQLRRDLAGHRDHHVVELSPDDHGARRQSHAADAR